MRNRALVTLLFALPILLAWIAAPAVAQLQPPFLYETRFVGVNPNGDDWAVVSAQEDPRLLPPTDLQGIFADYCTGGVAGATNTAAVLDGNYQLRVNGVYHPTGELFVAKTTPAGTNRVDVWCPVNWNANNLTRQEFPGPGGVSDNTVVLWQFNTASGNPIQAMDIACGVNYGPPTGTTNFVITAETLNGFLYLVVYAITGPGGNVIQPVPVTGFPTGLQSATCLGLTTSPCRVAAQNGQTLNEIVYVTTDPVNGLVARAITFDIVTLQFGQTASTYQVPYPLNHLGTTIAGVWIAQNNPLAQPFVFAHHVGISVPSTLSPTTPGSLVILPANSSTTLIPSPIDVTGVGVGGGPLSHIPFGHNPAGAMTGGPVHHIIGSNGGAQGPGPTGWFLVTPRQQGPLIHAVEPGGTFTTFGAYLGNTVANGTPLAHPAEISISGVQSQRKGVLWVPYRTTLGAYGIEMWEGAPSATFYWNVTHTIGNPLNGNFQFQALLPKQQTPPLSWTGTAILPDQKVNFKQEYAMYLTGY